MDIEVKLPPDFEEHIASIKWSMRPFANRNLFKIDHLLIRHRALGRGDCLERVLINRPAVSAFGQTGHRADKAE